VGETVERRRATATAGTEREKGRNGKPEETRSRGPSGLLVAAEVGRAASCWPSNIHFVNIWLSFSLAIFLLDLEAPLLPKINKNHAIFHGNMIAAGRR